MLHFTLLSYVQLSYLGHVMVWNLPRDGWLGCREQLSTIETPLASATSAAFYSY